jgi:hypothetical protein
MRIAQIAFMGWSIWFEEQTGLLDNEMLSSLCHCVKSKAPSNIGNWLKTLNYSCNQWDYYLW